MESVDREFEAIPQGSYETFSPAEFAARLAKVRAGMQDRRLDLLLVTSPENIYYLTG